MRVLIRFPPDPLNAALFQTKKFVKYWHLHVVYTPGTTMRIDQIQ